jgi:outer membrane receptor protein involved in Fe transport
LTNQTWRNRLLASSMITGVAMAAVASSAVAQTAPDTSSTKVQEFVVTGSRIPQPNLTSVSPVTAVTSAEIKSEGVTRVEDLINQLPQVLGSQGAFISNGASGTATINLRNLGSKRNLVLIDGVRLGAGDPFDPVADINFIPGPLVDRVDVLTGGASAVYGADAVAGVTNFIMKKDFTGLQLDANYAGYQHYNGDGKSQAANAARGFSPPTGNVFDGQTVDISLIFGANSPDGKGNVEGYLDYRHIDPVTEATRDYSNCTVAISSKTATAPSGYTCGGSGTNRYATIFTYNANFAGTGRYQVDPTVPGQLNTYTGAASQLYNYAPENYYQRNDQRYSGGFFAHYDITPHLTAYSNFMFMDDQSNAQIAESGDFGLTSSIPCNNPLLSAQEVQDICVKPGYSTAAAPTVGTATNILILRRNVEGGPRISELEHTDYRAQIGLKGDLGANWHFDAYGMYYDSIYSSAILDYFSNAKLLNALDAIPGPNGTAVCAVGGSCVPYNPFTTGGVTPAQLAYLDVPGLVNGSTSESVVSGALTGDLGAYGVKSPYAKEGVGVSFGAEYRRETLATLPDAEVQSGDLAGSGGKTPPVSGAFDVKEIFGEARIPLVNDMPFVKELTTDVGYRFSHYNNVGNTYTYKIDGEWAINDDVRIRGGFNHAVRAPNVQELYSQQTVGLDGSSDPCAGAIGSQTLTFTQAQCANTGVSAAQYGNISANPAAQYNGLQGGNPKLKPETANTYTVGVVVTPVDLVKGISFSADYFNINITNVIAKAGFQSILNDCALTGNQTYCALVHRAPGNGSLWIGPNGYVTDTLQNLGFLKTDGVDFTFDYHGRFTDYGLGNWGGIALNFLGTYTNSLTSQGAAGTPINSCVNKYGPTCGLPLPFFKAKTRLTWTTPVDGLSASLAWRYIGSANLDTGNMLKSDSVIPSYSYFDLSAQWRVKDRYTFRVGVNNIFDIQPPIIGSGENAGNGNTFPQVYDPLGRYLFAGVTADF